MNETLAVFWIILGTVAVTLLAVLTGVGVVTLLDVRLTARRMRETLDSMAPSAGQAIDNLRELTGSARDAARGMRNAGEILGEFRSGVGRIGPWIPLVVGIFGAISAMRARRRAARS